jgi:hypothetical protein
MGKQAKKGLRETLFEWLLRFIKFNIIGLGGFLVVTCIFVFAFSFFGEWTWIVASGTGGLLQFFLISYLNTTKIGKIFESSKQSKQ